MTNGELHEISRAIGGLEAKAEALALQAIDGAEARAEILGQLVELHRKLDALGTAVEDMRPAVDDWRRARERALGGAVALVGVAGAIGACADRLIGWLGRHLS
jgi:hypothetical protein